MKVAIPGPQRVGQAPSTGIGRKIVVQATQPSSRGGPIEQLVASIPDPVVKNAVKEPLAFWGGVFAGALNLNLQEDPLRAWIDRTARAAQAGMEGTQPPSTHDRLGPR